MTKVRLKIFNYYDGDGDIYGDNNDYDGDVEDDHINVGEIEVRDAKSGKYTYISFSKVVLIFGNWEFLDNA